MAFYIIHDDGGTFTTYNEEGALIEYGTWSLANAAISENSLISAVVVEEQLTEPVAQNVDDAEVNTVVAEIETEIQAVVESVGIRWLTAYKTGTPGSLPPFLPKHSAERALYTELVAKRAAFADLTA